MPIEIENLDFQPGKEYSNETVAKLLDAMPKKVNGNEIYLLNKTVTTENRGIDTKTDLSSAPSATGASNEMAAQLTAFIPPKGNKYKVGGVFLAGEGEGSHFIGAVFDKQSNTLTIIDPLAEDGRVSENFQASARRIEEAFTSKFGDDIQIETNPSSKVLHQTDVVSCGAACVYTVQSLLKDEKLQPNDLLGIIQEGDKFSCENKAPKLREHQRKRFAAYEKANALDEQGNTPLLNEMLTIRTSWASNNMLGLKQLIDDGADVNGKDERGNVPLISAAEINDEAVKILLEAGANVNGKNREGETPLHRVVHLKSAKLLLEAGADVNVRDEQGRTPLDAVVIYSSDIPKLLLDKGADIGKCKDETINSLYERCGYDPYLEVQYGEKLKKILAERKAKIPPPSPPAPEEPTPPPPSPSDTEEAKKKRRVSTLSFDSIGASDAIDKLWQEREEELKKILTAHHFREHSMFDAEGVSHKMTADELIKHYDQDLKSEAKQDGKLTAKEEIDNYKQEFATKLAAKMQEEGQELDFSKPELDLGNGTKLKVETIDGSKLKRVTINEEDLKPDDNITMSIAFQDKNGENMNAPALYFQILVDDGKITSVNHPPLFQDKKGQYYAVSSDGEKVYPKLDLKTIEHMLTIEKEIERAEDHILRRESRSEAKDGASLGKDIRSSFGTSLQNTNKVKPPSSPRGEGKGGQGLNML